MNKRSLAIGATCVVVLVAAVAPAVAKKPDGAGNPGHGGGQGKGPKAAQTSMTFKLEDHEVDAGEVVTGAVLLETGKGKSRTPIAGATLEIAVDGQPYSTVVTDGAGMALVLVTTTVDGEHNIRVTYTGDATRRSAQRTQGFVVGANLDDEG